VKELYINEVNILPNYYNSNNTPNGFYIEGLFPESLKGNINSLLNDLNGEGITNYESINGLQLKDNDSSKIFDVLQGTKKYEDLGIKKVKKIFTNRYLNHPNAAQ